MYEFDLYEQMAIENKEYIIELIKLHYDAQITDSIEIYDSFEKITGLCMGYGRALHDSLLRLQHDIDNQKSSHSNEYFIFLVLQEWLEKYKLNFERTNKAKEPKILVDTPVYIKTKVLFKLIISIAYYIDVLLMLGTVKLLQHPDKERWEREINFFITEANNMLIEGTSELSSLNSLIKYEKGKKEYHARTNARIMHETNPERLKIKKAKEFIRECYFDWKQNAPTRYTGDEAFAQDMIEKTRDDSGDLVIKRTKTITEDWIRKTWRKELDSLSFTPTPDA